MKGKKDGPDIPAMTDKYKRDNRVAATVIVKNPTAFPPGGVMERWAQMVLAKEEVKP
jgi:hypothetical protein